MKKDIIKWMMGYACFLAFISCSQTEEGMQLRNENGIRFSARIASPATRVTEQAFEPGDNISVFAFTDNQGFLADAYAANVKYSYSDGAFRPAAEEGIAYPTNGGLAFWAIYPYCEQAASTFNFEVAEDQSTAAAYGTSDLMTASTSLTTEQNPALSFYHRLACVKFKCSFEEAEEKVVSITVNNVQKNVSIDLSNNTYEGAGEMISGLLPYRNDDGSYKILLPPQTIATGTSFMVVHTTAGKEYTWKVPRDLQLASGCRYTYNLKVSAGREIVFSSSINPWNQEEKDVKKRVKQMIWEGWSAGELLDGNAYNYKYDEQGRLIDCSGPTYGVATGSDSTKISYIANTIIAENKEYIVETDKNPYTRTSRYVYTLDDKGLVIKINDSTSGEPTSESALSYTNGYLTTLTRNTEGSVYSHLFEWTDGKMTKMWIDENHYSTINYTSTAGYKAPFSVCGMIVGIFCETVLDGFFPLPNTYFGNGMEYLPAQTKCIWLGDPPVTETNTYETDADDYVTKLVVEDSYNNYTTYTFTYENIE